MLARDHSLESIIKLRGGYRHPSSNFEVAIACLARTINNKNVWDLLFRGAVEAGPRKVLFPHENVDRHFSHGETIQPLLQRYVSLSKSMRRRPGWFGTFR
jgi:hypothetical protein